MGRPAIDFRQLYNRFDAPVTDVDCGTMCAPHNPSGKPFCCDICHAVPAAYESEWSYLRSATDLWHAWRGDECAGESGAAAGLRAQTPENMRLLACLGPRSCQRPFRALSCRQFPFFPYIAADGRFLGLAYEWEFAPVCWVISRLDRVSPQYRSEFIRTFDRLFELWPDELEGYAVHADEMRAVFVARRRRIPLLHRNGRDYLLSPGSEQLERVAAGQFPRFGPYLNKRP